MTPESLNPESRNLLHLVTPGIATKIRDAIAKTPELFGMEESELKYALKDRRMMPSATDCRLRLKFWHEYDRAQATMDKMHTVNVYAGVCSKQVFDIYMARAEKVAWLCCQPASYQAVAEEVLHYGYGQLRDILELPHVDEFGKVNTKLMELKLKITAVAELRTKGAVVQKIEQKTLGINVSASTREALQMGELRTMEEIDRKLKELDKRDRRALHSPETAMVPRTLEPDDSL